MDRVETGMGTVELSAGTVEVRDTGGDGPVVVLIGGLAIGPSLWREVVDDLRADHRCVVPTLPWGAHRIPMRPGADLTLRGHAALVAELLEALDLRDVVLVENDTGHGPARGGRPRRAAGRARADVVRGLRQLPARPGREGGRPARPAPRRPVPGHAAAAAPAAAPHAADLRVDVPAPDPRRRARRLAAPAPDRPRDPPRSSRPTCATSTAASCSTRPSACAASTARRSWPGPPTTGSCRVEHGRRLAALLPQGPLRPRPRQPHADPARPARPARGPGARARPRGSGALEQRRRRRPTTSGGDGGLSPSSLLGAGEDVAPAPREAGARASRGAVAVAHRHDGEHLAAAGVGAHARARRRAGS